MPKHGKNFRKALEGVNLQDRFSIEDAVSKSLGASFAKFDETVDVAIRLGVDPKYSDQMVRGAVTLPHGLGKTVRVAVFCKGEKQAEAKAAGADFVGAEDLVAKVKEGWLDFDASVATPDVMALVGQIGRLLGPRGLMPNAKTGSVTFDVTKAVTELKAGRVDFKVDKAGLGADCPRAQRDENFMAWPISFSFSRSSMVPRPWEILSRMVYIWRVPIRQGEHLPQDSSTQNSM